MQHAPKALRATACNIRRNRLPEKLVARASRRFALAARSGLARSAVDRSSLSAGDGVAVAHALGQPALAPALAAVLGAEHLADAGYRIDLVRIFRVRRDAHHCRIGLDAVVEALPGLRSEERRV